MRIWDWILRLFGTNRAQQLWRKDRTREPQFLDGFPLVTATLMGACALLFYLALRLSADMTDEEVGLTPERLALVKLGADNVMLVRKYGEWWRPLTSMLLHAGAMHILFNGIALWTVGVVAEERFGRARAFVAFVIAGAAGQWASIFYYRPDVGVGASGAVFGLIAMCVVHALRTRDTELRARFVPWLIYGLLFGFFMAGVDNAAHLGGLVTGALLGLVVGDVRSGRRAPDWLWGVVAVALIAAFGYGFYMAAQTAQALGS